MLEIRDVSFGYGKKRIFRGFDLTIPDNQVCLVTGINGVGKSTLLRLIAGTLRPEGGEIRLRELRGPGLRQRIGFISDALSLYESLAVDKAVDLHMSAYGGARFDDSLVRHMKIPGDRRIRELSVGQKTLFHLSLILSTGPEVLLIDEIIHSTDAYLRKLFLDALVRILAERRLIVIMVNLNFHDIEQIVDRVVLLKDGRIAVDETIENLKARVKKIVSADPPADLPVLLRNDYSGQSEYFVYPFDGASAAAVAGEIQDLNLTEIVTAFIGGEYV